MPNTSLISTVCSEFSIYLGDCEQQSYDFNLEVAQKGQEESIHVRLRLEVEGLAVWVAGNVDDALEDELYNAVRGLPIVRNALQQIRRRLDEEQRQAL
jgi:hypothetical protein